MMLQAGVPIWIAVIVSLAFGAALGCVHGFGVRKMGMPPFIMTLATLTSLRGLGFLITGGNSVSGLPPAFTGFSRLTFLGIPSLFWVVILVAVCGHVFLRHSRWGRYIYAVGSNAEATRLFGNQHHANRIHRLYHLGHARGARRGADGKPLVGRSGVQRLLDVNPYWERIVTGLLIVAIVFVDQLRHRRR
jgi:ribose transport system permease protein